MKKSDEPLLEVIEVALTDCANEFGRGKAIGLCGGFYLAGIFTKAEWEFYNKLIPRGPYKDEY